MTILVKSGATISTTGGTSKTFTKHSEKVDGTRVYKNLAQLDSRLCESILLKSADPKTSATAPNGLSQAKNTASFIVPQLLANGKFTSNGADIVLHFDVEATEAHRIALLDGIAQLCTDSIYRTALLQGVTLP